LRTSQESGESCNDGWVDSFLVFREVSQSYPEEAVMSGQKKPQTPTPKPDANVDKKTSETVNLSAEELRKISGGAGAVGSNPKPPPTS
jgi:hypothetical protein